MIKNKQSRQLGVKSLIDVFNDDSPQEAKNILYIPSNQERSIN